MATTAWRPVRAAAGPSTDSYNAEQVAKIIVRLYLAETPSDKIGTMFRPSITRDRVRAMLRDAGVLRAFGTQHAEYDVQGDDGQWTTVTVAERDAFIEKAYKTMRLVDVAARIRPEMTKQALSIILIKRGVPRRSRGRDAQPFKMVESESPFLNSLRAAVVATGMTRLQMYEACAPLGVPKHTVYAVMAGRYDGAIKGIAVRVGIIAAGLAAADLPIALDDFNSKRTGLTAADLGTALNVAGIARLESAGMTHATSQRLSSLVPPVLDGINVILAIAQAAGKKIVTA